MLFRSRGLLPVLLTTAVGKTSDGMGFCEFAAMAESGGGTLGVLQRVVSWFIPSRYGSFRQALDCSLPFDSAALHTVS